MSNEMITRRKEAAHRRRRIIFNNDGSEWDYCREATVAEVLRINTSGLVGSHVDAIFYSTTQHFNEYVHNSKVADVFHDPNGIIEGLIDQGTDQLQIMVNFCHEHDMEIFWSLRVNDEHDAWVAGPGTQWKMEHPECLFGTRDNAPPHGPWSSVDYAQPAVRDLLFETIRDVCERYDIDGIELDFFRQLLCFKKHVWGEPLGEEEVEIINNHLRRIRDMTEAVGKKRDRPLLIAARMPDCPQFARQLALDVEGWLEQDLIDIMVVGGYFWLRPWEQSVELGHKYGVPVYTSLDASRITDKETQLVRRSDNGYRAHAANAWAAGADGIYVFNLNYMRDPTHRVWREIGDPETLKGLDKIYHVSVMGAGHPSIDYYVPNGSKFLMIPRLCPDHPLKLLGGQVHRTILTVGENMTATGVSVAPKTPLNVKVTGLLCPDQLVVKLNDRQLSRGLLTWQFQNPEDWLEYTVEPQQIRKGCNELEIALTSGTDHDITRSTEAAHCTLHDVHLRVEHGAARSCQRRRDLTMSRNRFLAYHDSLA